jgi:uncharacterized protein YgiM (DUF1202 family)
MMRFGGVGCGRLLRPGHVPGARSRGALLLLLLTAELCTVVVPAFARVPTRQAETIVETRLRAEPKMRGEPLLKLPAGTTLTVRGKPEQGWYQVRRGPLEGYVRSGDVATAPSEGSDDARASEAIDEPRLVEQTQFAAGNKTRGSKDERKQGRKQSRKEDKKAQRKQERKRHGRSATRDTKSAVTSTILNLRESPSQDAAVRASIPRGERVEPTGEHRDGWVELRWQGDTGWALGRYLAAPRRVSVRQDGDPSSWSRNELKAIIFAAADRYGQPREDMLRVARCESDLVPSAVNEHGGSYGLFQFKPGTWLSTPFGEYDIFDPRASANAAAWMWAEGRRREWVCQ